MKLFVAFVKAISLNTIQLWPWGKPAVSFIPVCLRFLTFLVLGLHIPNRLEATFPFQAELSENCFSKNTADVFPHWHCVNTHFNVPDQQTPKTSAFSGKAIFISVRHCQATFCIYYNSMAVEQKVLNRIRHVTHWKHLAYYNRKIQHRKPWTVVKLKCFNKHKEKQSTESTSVTQLDAHINK